MWENTPEQRETLVRVSAARGLFQRWKKGVDITDILNDPKPNIQKIIAEVTVVVEDEGVQRDWIAVVLGDGKSQYRRQLAEKCSERVKEKINRYSSAERI